MSIILVVCMFCSMPVHLRLILVVTHHHFLTKPPLFLSFPYMISCSAVGGGVAGLCEVSSQRIKMIPQSMASRAQEHAEQAAHTCSHKHTPHKHDDARKTISAICRRVSDLRVSRRGLTKSRGDERTPDDCEGFEYADRAHYRASFFWTCVEAQKDDW